MKGHQRGLHHGANKRNGMAACTVSWTWQCAVYTMSSIRGLQATNHPQTPPHTLQPNAWNDTGCRGGTPDYNTAVDHILPEPCVAASSRVFHTYKHIHTLADPTPASSYNTQLGACHRKRQPTGSIQVITTLGMPPFLCLMGPWGACSSTVVRSNVMPQMVYTA